MINCPFCGSELPDGSAFCGYCGNRIEAEKAAPQPQTAPQYTAAPQPQAAPQYTAAPQPVNGETLASGVMITYAGAVYYGTVFLTAQGVILRFAMTYNDWVSLEWRCFLLGGPAVFLAKQKSALKKKQCAPDVFVPFSDIVSTGLGGPKGPTNKCVYFTTREGQTTYIPCTGKNDPNVWCRRLRGL